MKKYLSIVICSRTKRLKSNFEKNIEATIGLEYELIVIDNSKNQYSIFEAYNLGIEKSTTDYLCFIHDDISIHTTNWGLILLNIFKDYKSVGLVGIAGTKVKSKMPSPWWNCKEEVRAVNIIQHDNEGHKETISIGFNSSFQQEVVVIDGVFIALRKSTGIKFTNKLKGFHNYDLNISFECLKKGYKILVTKQIMIEHYSLGSLSTEWVKSTYKIHQLYKSILPLQVKGLRVNRDMEIKNSIRFMENCITYNVPEIFKKTWFKLLLFYPNPVYHFKLWKRYSKF